MIKLTLDNIVDVVVELFPEFKNYREYESDYIADVDFKTLLLDIFGRFAKEKIEMYGEKDIVVCRIFDFINEQINRSDSDAAAVEYLTKEVFENLSPSEKCTEVSRKLLKGKALESFNETAKYF